MCYRYFSRKEPEGLPLGSLFFRATQGTRETPAEERELPRVSCGRQETIEKRVGPEGRGWRSTEIFSPATGGESWSCHQGQSVSPQQAEWSRSHPSHEQQQEQEDRYPFDPAPRRSASGGAPRSARHAAPGLQDQ